MRKNNKIFKKKMRSTLVPVKPASINLPRMNETNISLPYKKSSDLPFENLPVVTLESKETVESLINTKRPESPVLTSSSTPVLQISNPAITVDSSITKMNPSSSSTAVFGNYEGTLPNAEIEKSLLSSGFVPTEKILTKDDNGNLICHFIKTRDNVGRISYVELDCDDSSGMGYIAISPTDTVLTSSREASIIPYSLSIGSFEANKGDIYGVGFECDNSICVMTRKDSSLEPVQTVFHSTKNNGNDVGIIENHYVPFPIVKMSEILVNPSGVHRGITTSHARMRNVSFSSCNKEVITIKEHISSLQKEIIRFDNIAKQVTEILSSSIGELEKMHEYYNVHGTRTASEVEKLKAIQFNLAKRNDLALDYIALCHSMKERSIKIAALRDELKAFNDFSQTLFTGIDSVFVE